MTPEGKPQEAMHLSAQAGQYQRRSETPRHLAVFVYDFTGRGAQRRTVTLANAFAERGYHVDLVVVRLHGPLESDLSPRVRLVVLNPWWNRLPGVGRIRGRWPLGGVPALVSYLRSARPEVLLSASNHVNRATPLACLLARTNTRLVLRVSTWLGWYGDPAQRRLRRLRLWQVRRLYPLADALIAVSKGVADDVVGVTGISGDRITTVYNPAATAELRAKANEPLDHPWFSRGGPPVILGAGTLRPQKDFSTLLRAFARVRARREARLVILGEGRERKRLTRLARRLGITGDLDLPGFVPNPYPYMARASLLALSSRWEGLPGVLIEAMACGCPVVSTDCPSGPAEILEGGAYGPLVPVGDEAAMAEAIISTLNHPPTGERLRARAAEFSVDRAVKRYLEVMLDGDGCAADQLRVVTPDCQSKGRDESARAIQSSADAAAPQRSGPKRPTDNGMS